jgi:hypothetical protein
MQLLFFLDQFHVLLKIYIYQNQDKLNILLYINAFVIKNLLILKYINHHIQNHRLEIIKVKMVKIKMSFLSN